MAVRAGAKAAGVTVCSLGEIQVYGMRAARGAGMHWGLAEEAGNAARWLAAHGLPGAQPLAGLLERNDGAAYADIAPQAGGRWRARAGTLCPICTGAAIADRLAGVGETPLQLERICYPILLLPFFAGHRDAARSFTLSWGATRVTIDERGPGLLSGDVDGLTVAETARVRVSPGRDGPAPAPLTLHTGGVQVPDRAWCRLQALAHRIYVPASDASRSRGAGANLDDND